MIFAEPAGLASERVAKKPRARPESPRSNPAARRPARGRVPTGHPRPDDHGCAASLPACRPGDLLVSPGMTQADHISRHRAGEIKQRGAALAKSRHPAQSDSPHALDPAGEASSSPPGSEQGCSSRIRRSLLYAIASRGEPRYRRESRVCGASLIPWRMVRGPCAAGNVVRHRPRRLNTLR